MKVKTSSTQPKPATESDIIKKLEAKFGDKFKSKKKEIVPKVEDKIELSESKTAPKLEGKTAEVIGDIGANNPNDPETREKLKHLLTQGAFNFSEQEKAALSKILDT